MNNPSSYRISSRSSQQQGSRRQQEPARSTVLNSTAGLEEDGLHQQPGAFRIQDNRPPSGNSDSVPRDNSTIDLPLFVTAEDTVIRVPEAQLVDPNETEAAIARALEEAAERAGPLVTAQIVAETDQQLRQRPKERERGRRVEIAEEGRPFAGIRAFVRKHSVLSCIVCSVLLLGIVGAALRETLASSTSTSTNRERDGWTQVGSTLKGVTRGDHFGDLNTLALSSDGAILAVGAPFNNEAETRAGSVQVFQRRGGTDKQQADDEWQPMGAALNGVDTDDRFDRFGDSVALSSNGQILAIGATEYNTGRPGYARIFEYDSSDGQWNQRGSKIEGVAAFDLFGSSVALSSDGNKLAVGAPLNDDNGSDAGHVRVFSFDINRSEWVQEGSTLTGFGASDFFGLSVDLSYDGTILAVGAPSKNDNESDSGHVRVYQLNGKSNDWVPLGAAIPGVMQFDAFGWSVALSANGMTMAAGARYNDDNGENSGHVRVFDFSSSTEQWIQRGSAMAGVAVGDWFGYSVALSADGSEVAAGAIFNSDIATSSGHLRVFQYEKSSDAGQWKQVGAAMTGVGGDNDQFGSSVAMSANGTVVAGGADESHPIDDFEGAGYVCVYEGPGV